MWKNKQNRTYYSIDVSVMRRYKVRLLVVTMIPVLALLLGVVTLLNKSSERVLAASYTWDGGGVSNNWSDCDNWSTNICPVAGDTLTFNGTSVKNSVVDVGFGGTVTSLTMASGYTGTISLGRSLTLSSAFVLGGASTFTAGAHALQTNTFSLGAGTFNAPSATLTVSSTFSITGGTFNHNNGTVIFNGGGSSIICNGATFNLAQLQNTGAKTVNSSCSLPLGTNPTVSGTITLSGSLTGSGTLTFAAASIISSSGSLSGFTGLVTSALTVNGATLNLGSYSLVDINSTFILNSGSNLTAPTGEASFASGFTLNSGSTFNHNNGTVVIDGGTGTLSCNNASFNLVRFENTATKTVSSNCIMPLGIDPTVGRLALSGTLTGSGTLEFNHTSSSSFSAGAAITGFDGILGTGGITIAGADIDLSSYNSVDFNGAFTLSSGSLTAPTGEASFASNFTISGGTFNHNNGTLIFDGTTGTISCNNTIFNLVEIATTTGATIKTINSDCNLPLGDNPTIGDNRFTLNGTLTGTGTLNASYIILNAGASLSGFDGLVVNDLLSVATDTNLSTYTPVDFGRFSQTAGTFTAPSDMSVSSTFAIVGGNFNHNNGTVIFGGTSTSVISCNNVLFHKVEFEHTAGNKTVSDDCSLPLGHNPNVGSAGMRLQGTLSGSGLITFPAGTLRFDSTAILNGFDGLATNHVIIDNQSLDLSDFNVVDINDSFNLENNAVFKAPLDTMTIAGNITINPGSTFNANNGTVVFDGGDQKITGDITLHNLTKTIPSGFTTPTTLTFGSGSTTIVNGLLTLQGTSTNLLNLVSSTPGSQWFINATGTRNLRYLSVQDSNNINASAMLAYDSTDLGNNINWQFPLTPVPVEPLDPDDPIEPTGAVTNFGLGQASLAIAAAIARQQQNAQAFFANLQDVKGTFSRPSGIIEKVPGGRETVTTIIRFLAGSVIMLVLIVTAIWIVLRAKHRDETIHNLGYEV